MATNDKVSAPGKISAVAQQRLDKFNTPEFWTREKVDEETGELSLVPRYRYLEGKPRGYRADMKAGSFNIEGITPLGKSLTIQAVAWNFFSGRILGGKDVKDWAELFFFDKAANLCSLLFHGYTVENLMKLEGELFYSDRSLSDVLLTISFEQKTQSGGDGAKYYIGVFSQEPAADTELTRELQFWAKRSKIYRKETANEDNATSVSKNYYNPYHAE